MPTTTPKPPPMPSIEVPPIDPESGKWTPDWYRWLAAWESIWRKLRSEIP